MLNQKNELLVGNISYPNPESINAFRDSTPFNYMVIDGFFDPAVAWELYREFPHYDSPIWHTTYNSPVERFKRTCNHWDRFPKTTYQAFSYLNSKVFLNKIWSLTGLDLDVDVGLHGGGWHCHKTGGSLNVHKDYSIHPKLGLERKLNLIVYMTPGWNQAWGGGLELWSNDPETGGPKERVVTVDNHFNRAVLFDTTQDSWHGLPEPISCPDIVCRNSLAVYYLTKPSEKTPKRGRALFAPYGEQKNDPEILDLIEKRSQ